MFVTAALRLPFQADITMRGGEFDKIGSIKILRAIAALGLKEAKYLCEDAQSGATVKIEINCRDDLTKSLLRELRSRGWVINDNREQMMSAVKQLAYGCSEQEHFDLAADLFAVLAKYNQ